MTNHLARNRHLVEDLTSAVRYGSAGLDDVPRMLRVVLEEEAWREFTTQLGEHVVHEYFEQFVTEKPLRGLGASVDLLRRVIADEPEVRDLLDQVLQAPHGGDRSKSKNVTHAPAGNTADKALRRLRKEAEAGNQQAAELRAEVLAGRLSAHAAMIKAGFRPRTFSVRADSPKAVAAALRRQLDPAALAELRRLLDED